MLTNVCTPNIQNEESYNHVPKKALLFFPSTDNLAGIALAEDLFQLGYQLYAPISVAHTLNQKMIPTSIIPNGNPDLSFDYIIGIETAQTISDFSAHGCVYFSNIHEAHIAIAS